MSRPAPDPAAVMASPRFQELVRTRRALGVRLTLMMLFIYFGFVMIVAFAPQWFAVRLGDSVVTLGIPIGLGVIVIAFVLTGIYVARANARFDRLTRDIVEEFR